MAVVEQRYEAPLEDHVQREAGLPVVITVLLLFLSPLVADLIQRLYSLLR